MPPIECLVELPLSAGDETPGTRAQFTVEPVGEHEEQIDHDGESRA